MVMIGRVSYCVETKHNYPTLLDERRTAGIGLLLNENYRLVNVRRPISTSDR